MGVDSRVWLVETPKQDSLNNATTQRRKRSKRMGVDSRFFIRTKKDLMDSATKQRRRRSKRMGVDSRFALSSNQNMIF